MKSIDIVAMLEKPKPLNKNTWIACCPAHDDKTPSFQIKELSDGKILFHCFAGCSVSEICAALEIDIGDLFPDEGGIPVPYRHRSNTPTLDTHYIAICKAMIKRGERLSDVERQKYIAACNREARNR